MSCMSNDLKSLIRLGAINSIQSLSPILVWTLLGLSLGDVRYSDGFIMTYIYQFIGELIYAVVFKGQLKSETKNNRNNHEASHTGIRLLLIIYTVVFVIQYLFRREILSVMSIKYENEGLFLFGTAQVFMDWILYAIATLYQYDLKNIKSLRIILIWYVSKFACIITLSRLFCPDLVMILISIIMYVLLCVLIIRECFKTRVSFSIVDGIKYSLYEIPQSIGMTIIYAFGISSMAYRSAAVLSAYNMMSMCTDIEWDIMHSSIDTIGTLKVKGKEFVNNKKSLFRDSAIYAIILILVSALTISVFEHIPSYKYSVDFNIVWTMFLLECLGFPV